MPLTRFFGREQELRLLQAFLQSRDTRFLTLMGPGGTGKTRLALEAARHFVSSDAQAVAPGSAPARAVFFVSLESVGAASHIMPAIYRALLQTPATASQENSSANAPQEDGPRLRAAVARLLGRIAYPLLILDNCEHLADNADTARVLADLLRACPLSILATSRVCLGVEGEQQLVVPPLPAPHQKLTDADTAADAASQDALLAYVSVQMFVDRARRARLNFALSQSNRDAVATLCERLEGIPLAIELCAAWAATLAPSEMLAALDNRFELLISRRPDVPPRHRSLYAAVESSYLQLPTNLQAAFCALSAFRGGWSAEAAQAIAATNAGNGKTTAFHIRNSLFALQERSLIFTETTDNASAAMRWRMLETLREFAWSRLSEEERQATASRHVAWFLQWAETLAPISPNRDSASG